jgi:hypothetical protein
LPLYTTGIVRIRSNLDIKPPLPRSRLGAKKMTVAAGQCDGQGEGVGRRALRRQSAVDHDAVGYRVALMDPR